MNCSPNAAAVPGARPRSGKRVLFRGFMALAFCFLFLELGSRGYWATRGVPITAAHRSVHRAFYPELINVEKANPSRQDDVLDLLLLGGSVPNNNYGNIEHLLRERLFEQNVKAAIYNVSMPGQTSLDSFYKYRHLTNKTFDLVIVYHGINEVRASNCPPDVFRADYSHYSWYNLINAWERKRHRWIVVPYTVRFFGTKFLDRLGWGSYVPTHQPRPADREWGGSIKTGPSFKGNIEGIVDLAKSKQEPIVLMTFAYHVPDDYSEERFTRKELDYRVHGLPIELWGKPEHVVRGIAAHNREILGLVSSKQTLFVDQQKLIPRGAEYFNDICHLTHRGCATFVDNLLPILLEETKRLPGASPREADSRP